MHRSSFSLPTRCHKQATIISIFSLIFFFNKETCSADRAAATSLRRGNSEEPQKQFTSSAKDILQNSTEFGALGSGSPEDPSCGDNEKVGNKPCDSLPIYRYTQ